jgi:hypothetical protein
MVAPLPERSEESMNPSFANPIQSFHFQMRKMPELTEQARAIDQVLLNRMQGLKVTASAIIDQFQAQKKVILQRFDQWMKPIAQDILDSFIQDAQSLKHKLDDKWDHLNQMTPEEWETEAKHWVQLYAKWNDRKELMKRILEVVAHRTTHLINKDLQVIHDYQAQSLSYLPHETKIFKDIEERLALATEEPLKQLMNLRIQAKEHTSLQQASEWIATLQERRENYFNQLLMKIDSIMKDVVNLEETKDWTAFIEVEGEVMFMEHELHHINQDLTHLHLVDESDKQFLLARLEGLVDHVEDLDKRSLPAPLRERMQALRKGVLSAISQIEKE